MEIRTGQGGEYVREKGTKADANFASHGWVSRKEEGMGEYGEP